MVAKLDGHLTRPNQEYFVLTFMDAPRGSPTTRQSGIPPVPCPPVMSNEQLACMRRVIMEVLPVLGLGPPLFICKLLLIFALQANLHCASQISRAEAGPSPAILTKPPKNRTSPTSRGRGAKFVVLADLVHGSATWYDCWGAMSARLRMPNDKPAHEVRLGAIKATIWRNKPETV